MKPLVLVRAIPVKQYKLLGVPGLVHRTRVGSDKPVRSIYFNAQAGIAGPGPWTLRCDTHGQSIPVDTQKQAFYRNGDPAGWCSGCEKRAGGER